MAASMNFRPGGAEEDDDDFDDDGFFLGSVQSEEQYKFTPFDPIKTATSQVVPREGFTGFGAPKPRSESAPKKSYKRSADKLSETDGRTLDMGDFQMAIVRGQQNIVKQFIDEGFKVDTVLKSGWTGLMYAASNASPEIVKILLQSNADANFHKDMYTVLMAGCGATGHKEQDVLECVNLLLDKGAKVDSWDRYHTTAMMYAAREGRSSVVKRLVEKGANVNKQNNRGWTSLTWAVSKQHMVAVKTLLDAGADRRLKHCDGLTVIDMAREADDDQMLALLEGRESENSGHKTDDKVQLKNGTSGLKTVYQPLRSTASSGTTYGELELFLCGLELSNLVDMFRNQRVDFNTFLQMTENDLIQMGINQIGVRKKIIDGIHSVHKKEWESTSLPVVHYNKQLSCAECIAMVANIAKHTKYITTTVSFLKDQLKRNPAILDELQDSTGPKQLHQHTVDTCQNISVLENQLKTMKVELAKTLKKGNFDPPDLIKKKQSNGGKTRRKVAAVVISGRCIICDALEKTVPNRTTFTDHNARSMTSVRMADMHCCRNGISQNCDTTVLTHSHLQETILKQLMQNYGQSQKIKV